MIERIEINLLPPEYRIHKTTTLRIPRSLIYPIVLFVVLACGAGFYTIYMRDTEAMLTQEIEDIEKEIAANKHIQAELDSLRKEKSVTEQKIMALQRISVDREKWVRLLEILNGSLPPYTWLISVREESGGDKLNIEARAYPFSEVAHYMSRLEASEYITKVGLMGVEQIQGQGRMVYKFNLVCDINRNVGLGELSSDDAGSTPAPDRAGQGGGRQQRRRGDSGGNDSKKKGGG